jgi:hypothetical protein
MAEQYRQEITVWKEAPNTPNHIYITLGSVLLGYIPVGGVEKRFTKAYRTWSVSRRKFKNLTKKEIAKLREDGRIL